ncbi:MAG: M56 family metallopeptidase [Pirellulaceae bacterium]
MTQFGLAIAWCAIQVGVVGLCAGLLLAATRRLPPSARATIALVSLVLVAALTAAALAPLPSWFDRGPTNTLVAGDLDEAIAGDNPSAAMANHDEPSTAESSGEAPAGSAGSQAALPSLGELWLEEMRAVEPVSPGATEARESRWWPTVVAVAFLMLAVAGVLQIGAGLVLVRHYRRASRTIDDKALGQQVDLLRAELCCRRRVELRQSPHLTTAATVGWLRPVVLLPRGWRDWTSSELQAVLAHELAHIARRDYLACLLAQAGLVLHYYHPLVHWLVGRLRLEQELAADAAASAVSGGRETYLRILAELALRQADHRLPLPARSFLPTRSTFLRRIDMLRNPRGASSSPKSFVLAAALALLVVVAAATSGLRMPGASTVIAAAPKSAEGDADGGMPQREPFAVGAFPSGGSFVIAIRPAELLARPKLSAVAKTLRESAELEWSIGIPLTDIEQVILAMPSPDDERRRDEKIREAAIAGKPYERPLSLHALLIRSTKPLKPEALTSFTSVLEGAVERRLAGKTYYELAAPNDDAAYYQPNPRTFVFGPRREIAALVGGAPSTAALLQSAGWRRVQHDDMAAAIDPTMVLRAFDVEPPNPLTTNLAMIRPLLSECRGVYYGARVDDAVQVQAVADCGVDGDPKPVKETVLALLTLGRNMSGEIKKAVTDDVIRQNPLAPIAVEMATALLDSAKVESTSERDVAGGKVRLVRVAAEAAIDDQVGAAFAQAVVASRAAAERAKAMNNLKQIAIALHNYHEVHGHFPASSILGPDGKTSHSWRVALLPYLEQEPLYDSYRLDEPWDSENNKKVLAQMPFVYRLPGDDAKTINAGVFVFTGDDAGFPGEPRQKGFTFTDLRDGASNTIFALEADREIPWTKPEDISYLPELPLPALGGYRDDGFNLALFDGSVHFQPQPRTPAEQKKFKALITKSGGEPR